MFGNSACLGALVAGRGVSIVAEEGFGIDKSSISDQTVIN